MTDAQVIETAEQIIELTNNLIDYCNETGGCKNCVFSKFKSSDLSCRIGISTIDLVDIVSNYFDLKYIHCSASNGLLKYRDDFTNLVRPGLIIYGYESFPGCNEIIDIKPICKLKTAVTYLKEVESGESISYSRKFISDKKMKVATIPIGYADGFRRTNTNIGEVIVNGKKCKVLGSVCMDSCMIDVTSIKNVKVGDTVYIWDNKFITLDDIANKCNTINYEVLSTISERVPRKFI